jgi:hypothetical protein
VPVGEKVAVLVPVAVPVFVQVNAHGSFPSLLLLSWVHSDTVQQSVSSANLWKASTG